MAWLIGIDEAGYGPNLGPLAIGATAWRIDTDCLPRKIDLYERLASVVACQSVDGTLALADSKQLYKPGGGLRLLERGIFTATGWTVTTFDALLCLVRADPTTARSQLPWYQAFELSVPTDYDVTADQEFATAWRNQLRQQQVEPPYVQARLVYPAEFNDLTQKYGTKGAALSHVTLGLARSVYERSGAQASGEPVYIGCDKHGGRNRYASLLQHHFGTVWPDSMVQTVNESRGESYYRWGTASQPCEFTFRSKGESFLPAALASMLAKYLRELSMKALNAYWQSHLPGLKPTAGYPVDAKRFKSAITQKQAALGIDDHILWRNR